jgi:DNA-3-methyladenine glycosylase II
LPGSGSQRDAVAVLRACDPILRRVIDLVGSDGLGDPRAGRPGDHYGALVRSIVGQQLSTKAARAIYGRLTDRFGGRTPTPAEVLADDPAQLRAAAGLSRAKVAYLRSLAEHVCDGSLELERLDELSDEAVIAELVAVRGLGLWSAQMFLMRGNPRRHGGFRADGLPGWRPSGRMMPPDRIEVRLSSDP